MKQILSFVLLLVCLSANAQDVITTEKAENTIQNELTLGLNGGSSLPVGLYASKSDSNYNGNAGAGSTYGLDVAMNFNGSRFGWLSTAFISNHACTIINSSSSGNFAFGRYYNGGILLGATYALPLKKRSALTFSAQLGYILTTVPQYDSYVETGNMNTPATYKKQKLTQIIAMAAAFSLIWAQVIAYIFRKPIFICSANSIIKRQARISLEQ